jgi:crossover junction endodeoxyribonuclease RuvC
LNIAEKIEGLLVQDAAISVIAIENVFFNQNVSSAISTRQVIGAVSVASAKHLVKVVSIIPQKAKAAVGAGGQANKAQVKKFVQKVCEMETPVASDHESDAIAIAMAALLEA